MCSRFHRKPLLNNSHKVVTSFPSRAPKPAVKTTAATTTTITLKRSSCFVDAPGHFDCHPDLGVTQSSCLRRGCCFQPNPTTSVPTCAFPADYRGYKVRTLQQPYNSLCGETSPFPHTVRPASETCHRATEHAQA